MLQLLILTPKLSAKSQNMKS